MHYYSLSRAHVYYDCGPTASLEPWMISFSRELCWKRWQYTELYMGEDPSISIPSAVEFDAVEVVEVFRFCPPLDTGTAGGGIIVLSEGEDDGGAATTGAGGAIDAATGVEAGGGNEASALGARAAESRCCSLRH